MEHCDTLILPAWCVPVMPADTVLTGHAVAVADGRILAVLPAAEAREKFQPSAVVERPGHVLIPGLVNAHTHAAMSLLRGISDRRPLETWLHDGIWPAEKAVVSAEFVRDGTELAIAEMLKGGVTCFADQYFYPEIIAETADDLDMRAIVGTPIMEFATSWANNADEYLQKAADLVHDPYADHPLIKSCFAPHSSAALGDEAMTELRVLADQLDIPVHIHLHETTAEVQRAVDATGLRPFARLDKLGLVNRSLLAVHAVHLTEHEVGRMAEEGVAVAHCPASNLKLGSGIAPVTRYRDAGIAVGLGTDGAASNDRLDLLSDARLAALISRANGDAGLDAFEALEMATLGSANALGLGEEIGSIEAGKAADLACVDLSPLTSQPVHEPLSQLLFAAGAHQVSDTWVAGRHLLDLGRLTHMDEGSIVKRANEWRERIAAARD